MHDKEHKHGQGAEGCDCGHGHEKKDDCACGGKCDCEGKEGKECCGNCEGKDDKSCGNCEGKDKKECDRDDCKCDDDKAEDGKCCGGEGYCACSGEDVGGDSANKTK